MEYRAQVLLTEFVTHDVTRFIVAKPEGLDYAPGQGVELAIDKPDWRDQGRPFTPTSLGDDRVLEFTIKAYADHDGVTRALSRARAGDGLLMSSAFGTIAYRGPGTFIAGGAGITPFLAIVRQLARDGQLAGQRMIFSNKTPADVICEKELRHYFGENCILICTRGDAPGYGSRRIDTDLLAAHVRDPNQHFYVCGPKQFVKDVNGALEKLGASPESLVYER